MFSQILLGRPKVAVLRRDNATTGKGLQESRGGYVSWGDDVVILRHTHHAVIECPVTEFAERHTVADVVVLAFAPGDDVSGIHDCVLFRRDDPHPAQGAAVVVGADHDPPEA